MIASIVALLAVLGPAGPAATPPPVSAFFGDQALTSASVSPDGTKLAVIDHAGVRPVVRVLTRSDSREVGVGDLDVRSLGWVDDETLLITRSAVVEAEPVLPRQRVLQAVAYNLRTGKSATLLDRTPDVAPILTGGWITRGHSGGRTYMYLRGLSAGPKFALYRADPVTGYGAVLTQPSLDALSWIVDDDGAVRARSVVRWDGQGTSAEVRTARGWRTLGEKVVLSGLTPDGADVLVWKDEEPYVVSHVDGSLAPLAVPAGRKVSGLGFDMRRRLVETDLAGEPFEEEVFHQPELAAGWPKLRRAFPDAHLEELSQSDDGRSVAFSARGAQDGGALYWADLHALRAEKVGDLRPAIPAGDIGRSSEINLVARDGLTLPSILTLPPHREAKALPLVVLPGGWPQDVPSMYFDPTAQMFASRGYAVLKVNVRGSQLNPALEAAGEGQAETGAVSDLIDAVADLGRRGIVDAGRACIVGGAGYGGYAALATVTLQEAPLRCAAAVEPEVDLVDAVRWPDENVRGPQQARVAAWRKITQANAPGARARLAALSPIHAAAHASAPVLLVTDRLGADATSRTRRMRDALKLAGKPVDYVELSEKTGDLGTTAGQVAAQTSMLDFVLRKNPA